MSKNESDSQINGTDDLRLQVAENGVLGLQSLPSRQTTTPPSTVTALLKKNITQRFKPGDIAPDLEAKLEHIVKSHKIDSKIEAELVNNPNSYLNDPEIIALFKQYDTNGDGQLDDEEMARVIQQLISKKRQNVYMFYVISGLLLLVIVHLTSSTLLTLWMLRVTKILDINNSNNYLTSTNGNLLATDSPRYYTLLTDIPSLPPKALNSLTRISFTTVDTSLHNYEVMGTQFAAVDSVNTVSLFFSSGKELRITPTSAVLRTYNYEGSSTDVGVIVNPAANAQQRRRQMVLDNNALALDRDLDDEFVDRCSNAEGICYHTFDEIIELHEILYSSGNGRMLAAGSGNAVTYAEVSADVVAFSKANTRSALDLAKDFLANIEKTGPTFVANTTVITFVMKDRCANYDSLIADCQKHAAPKIEPTEKETSILANGLYADVPFFGMTPIDGKWFFKDEITYRKDKDTIQLKVRYAHDPYRASRIHVVMVDRNNPSHVLSYDEVTTTTNPKKQTETLLDPQTFITNYHLDRIVEPGGALDAEVTREDSPEDMSRRRKLVADDAFHAHILTKISGFPKISILEDFIGRPDHEVGTITFTANSFDPDGRRLEETAAPVTIDVEVTGKGSYAIAKASDLGLTANTSEAYESLDGQYVAAYITGANADGRRLFFGEDVNEPKAQFDSPSVTNEMGYIVWPSQSDVVSLPDYESTEILYRSELKYQKDYHANGDSTSSNTERKLLEGFKDTLYHIYEDEDHEQNSWRRLQLSLDGSVDVNKPMPRFLQKSIESTGKHNAAFKELDAVLSELIGFVEERNKLDERNELEARRLQVSKWELYNGYSFDDFVALITGVGDPVDLLPPISIGALNKMIDSWTKTKILAMSYDNKDYWGPFYSPNVGIRVTQIQNTFGGLLWRLNNVTSMPYHVNATSKNCKRFYTQWGRTLNNLAVLVDVKDQIADVAQKTSDVLAELPTVRTAVESLIQVDKSLESSIPTIEKVPKVGIVLKVMAKAFNLAAKVLPPAKKGIEAIQDVDAKIKLKDKLDKFLEYNEKLSRALAIVSYLHFQSLGLTLLDQNCPGLSNVDTICSGIGVALDAVNNEVDKATMPLRTFKNQLSAIWSSLTSAKTFTKSVNTAAFDTLKTVMAKIKSFLDQRIVIKLTYPNFRKRTSCTWVTWPCGLHWCRSCWWCCCCSWVCGVHWCGGNACVDWWEPFIDTQTFDFKISDIINGLTYCIDVVVKPLMAAAEKAAEAMGFRPPNVLSIPNVPGQAEFNRAIDNLQRITVPSLDIVTTKMVALANALKPKLPICGKK